MASSYNTACPLCAGPIHITCVTAREISLPVRATGWAVMVTPSQSKGSESFACPKCKVTVPSDWVYKESSQAHAERLMRSWGANPYSIHNQQPLPKQEEPRKKRRKAATPPSAEAPLEKPEAPTSSETPESPTSAA